MMQDFVYLLGGFNGKAALAGCLRVKVLPSLEFGPSSRIPDMRVAKYDIAVATLLGRWVFAIAGTCFDNQTETHMSDCERFDARTNRWESVSPVLKPRSGPGICVFRERYLYIYAGQVDAHSQAESTIERYDTTDDSAGWIALNIVPSDERNGAVGAQVSDGEILMIGSKIECYINVGQEVAAKLRGIQTFPQGSTVPDMGYLKIVVSRRTMYSRFACKSISLV